MNQNIRKTLDYTSDPIFTTLKTVTKCKILLEQFMTRFYLKNIYFKDFGGIGYGGMWGDYRHTSTIKQNIVSQKNIALGYRKCIIIF